MIGGEEKNIIVYQFARIFFMVICRVVECGESGGMAYFSRILALLMDGGEWGFWWGRCQSSAWRFFLGGGIRVAAYRIAMEGTQKRRYFASA